MTDALLRKEKLLRDIGIQLYYIRHNIAYDGQMRMLDMLSNTHQKIKEEIAIYGEAIDYRLI